MNIKNGLLIIFIFLSACTTNVSRSLGPNYQLVIVDNSILRKYQIKLISGDIKTICVAGSNWTNSIGQIDTDGTNGVIYSTKGKFPAKGHNFGYCTDGCYIKILPKNQLDGFIPYSEFGDESQIAGLPDRQLLFDVYVNYCEK